MLSRLALGLLAVLVIAWSALMLEDAHHLNRGLATPPGGLAGLIAQLKTPQGFSQRVAELRQARLLNPDTQPELNIANDLQIRGRAGDLRAALVIAQSVVAAERSNLEAWFVIASVARGRHDSAGERAARAQILRLDPLIR